MVITKRIGVKGNVVWLMKPENATDAEWLIANEAHIANKNNKDCSFVDYTWNGLKKKTTEVWSANGRS